MKKKFLIIDGNSLIHRAYYAIPPLNDKNGIATNAVVGFANMLLKAIEQIAPNYIAVAFDFPSPNFRHNLYDQYKCNRKKTDDDLIVQIKLVKEMLLKMKIAILEIRGFEADDIIGTLATNKNTENIILTGDKDALQLINDNTIVKLTKKGISDIITINKDNIKSNYGYFPNEVTLYKALCGDKSDNIPGIQSVGEKTALDIIEKFKSLDEIYENLNSFKGKLKEKIIDGKEAAYLSLKLATIIINVPIEYKLDDLVFNYPFNNGLKKFFINHDMVKLVEKNIYNDIEEESFNIIDDRSVIVVNDINNWLETENLSCIEIGFSNFEIYTKSNIYKFNLDNDSWINLIKKICSDVKICIVDFDVKNLMHTISFGEIKNYFDIRLAQYLLDYLDAQLSEEEILKKHNVSNSLLLKEILDNELKKVNLDKLFFEIEIPLIKVLYYMEDIGFSVDVNYLNELNNIYIKEINKLKEEIYKIVGKEFNLNSPKQLLKVLFEDLKITYPNKKKKQSTNIEILEEIRGEHEIIDKIIEYRTKSKILNTYLTSLINKTVNGVIRTTFKQTLTTTGRLVSVDPNLQNIPFRDENGKILRKIFISRKNYILISADYSQIELRLLAHFSKDEELIAAFQHGEDIHADTASKIFGVDLSLVTKEMRRAAKAVNFGIIYGISEYGLAKNLNISVLEAKKYIDNYFDKYKTVKIFLSHLIEEAEKTQIAKTLYGRIRKVPQILSNNINIKNFGKRVAMNMPLQGTAADIIKIAMINIDKKLSKNYARILLQIHDELIIETKLDYFEDAKNIVKYEMENIVKLKVPLLVDISSGKTWYDC